MMTEQEWLASADPRALLSALRCGYAGIADAVFDPPCPTRATDRKLRLFACACEEAMGYESDEVAIKHPDTLSAVWCEPSANLTVAYKAALLRCLFGNPWRPVTEECRAMLDEIAGRHADVTVDMARDIYDSRDFAALPVLADALEEAGCPADVECPACQGTCGFQANSTWVPCELCDPAYPEAPTTQPGRLAHPLLAHLRGPGPHARGCWSIDLVLGKE